MWGPRKCLAGDSLVAGGMASRVHSETRPALSPAPARTTVPRGQLGNGHGRGPEYLWVQEDVLTGNR